MISLHSTTSRPFRCFQSRPYFLTYLSRYASLKFFSVSCRFCFLVYSTTLTGCQPRCDSLCRRDVVLLLPLRRIHAVSLTSSGVKPQSVSWGRLLPARGVFQNSFFQLKSDLYCYKYLFKFKPSLSSISSRCRRRCEAWRSEVTMQLMFNFC